MDDAKKKIRVLIVEDDPALLTVMTDTLLQNGFSVITAKNGEEGFQTAIQQKPDVIISDLLMPEMDGMTMLKKIRLNTGEYGKTVKAMILTNLEADDKVISDSVEAQPTYYLIKSDMNIEAISEKVREVLEN